MEKFWNEFLILKEEIKTFVEEKEKPFAKFNDGEWMCEFVLLGDIIAHMSVNTCLQGRDQWISSMFYQVRAFKIKLHLWKSQL
jgi:hypothetical protein